MTDFKLAHYPPLLPSRRATTITPGDSVRVIARRLNATLSMIGQPAYDFTIAWKTDEGTATARSNFEYVDWATQSNNDLAAAYALPRAEVDSGTSGAAAVFATVRFGAARRNQEI